MFSVSRKTFRLLALLMVAALMFGALGTSVSAQTVQLRILWYNDGNEGEVYRAALDKFEAANPGIKVTLDVVGFSDLHNTLQANIEGGTPPDMASITQLGRFQGRYLDLRPLLADAESFEANYPESFLTWLRVPGGEDKGIYGFPRSVGIGGPFVNVTLFEQAGVALPEGDDTTWEEWIALATQVAKATNTPYAIAIDRSGHRTFGPMMSYGAQILDPATGRFTVDSEGFRAFVLEMKRWHDEGLTPAEVWIGGGGAYRAAKEYFVNGELVFYYSGSWQISAFTKEIGDAFEWRAVPQPCGATGICGGMPGGTAIVAFAGTKHPKETAMVMEYLASTEVNIETSANSLFLTGNLKAIEQGVPYPASKEQFDVFLGNIPKLTEQGWRLQGHPFIDIINVETRDQLGRYFAGEIGLDEAIQRLQAKVDEACDNEPNKCLPW